MSSKCATCGGSDHKKSSSARCPQRKKRARESVGNEEPQESYTIKRGLCNFICPLLELDKKENLLNEIRRDVTDLSSFSIDFSILVHYFYTSRMVQLNDDTECLQLHPRFEGRALAAALSGDDSRKRKRVAQLSDPDGLLDIWRSMCRRCYDVKLRSFVVNHIVSIYTTVLETNLRTHAFARIKRAIGTETNLDKKIIHTACFERYYTALPKSGCPEVDEWFDTRVPEPPTAVALARDYWRFVPMFRRLQAEAWAHSKVKGGRGFRLFPQFRHGLKHMLYDSAALFELLRRADRNATPSTWKVFNDTTPEGEAGSRAWWRRYFAVPSNFGYSIRTDGVAVSLTMLKKVKESSLKTNRNKKARLSKPAEKALPNSPRGYVAVDPGAREPVVTCTEGKDGNLTFAKLTAGRVYFETGELWREKKRKRVTAGVEEKVRRDESNTETEEHYSSKHGGDPRAYTEFRHRHFDDLQRVYEKRKLARLKFEKYSRRQRFLAGVVKEFFPDRDKVILYGAGHKFMNQAIFRGHRKFSHDSLLRELKRSGRTVVSVDESYTTKRCYRCFGVSVVKVSPSPHRYVHCPVCRRGANRDRNGAANILLKTLGKWKCQLLFPAAVRVSCEGSTDSQSQ